uniref:NADH-ubiquinone oxidoreductase chain 4 n=1 Tax=Nephotettix cincticeps TaxID=94400 RepID=A0A0E3UR55_NEPCI|nr:NADH dehydrogenase subunit 4 [Nephotettix cincticeps]AKC91097.1 NADH dehydrogenase subunit 4 [Nephotettix cincticeps]
MMALLFFMIFMTPLCFINLPMIFQYSNLLILIWLILTGCGSFYNKISYFMGVDIISFNLILLVLLISSLMIISMMNYNWMSSFLFINLSLNLCLLIIFTSMNFLYMYVSFEFVLIPLVILIIGWGYQPERLMSGMYLLFYTMLVSLPLLILLVYIYMDLGSLFFDMMKLHSNFFLIHFILMIVFMVKMPMYLVHFWLPKAHVQAPVSGSMILAGLMLKIGGYGLIRSSFLYEYMYTKYSYIWFTISMLGSIYISITCLMQSDMKCLIAFSSISHMGLVIMGLINLSNLGLMGSYYLMLAHGFCSSGMFYVANIFYSRTNSRSFYINKGLMIYLPSGCIFWFMFCCFNMSCPPSLNFISELMILTSMVNFWNNSIYFFIFISFFCACFSYYLFSFSQHGLYSSLYSFSNMTCYEYLCMYIHLIPLIFSPVMISSFF